MKSYFIKSKNVNLNVKIAKTNKYYFYDLKIKFFI